MDKDVFLGWLSGLLELVEPERLELKEAKAVVESIQDHLKLVVKKVTPDRTKVAEPVNPIIKPAPDNRILPQIPATPLWPPNTYRYPPYPGQVDDYWLDRLLPNIPSKAYGDEKHPPGTVIC